MFFLQAYFPVIVSSLFGPLQSDVFKNIYIIFLAIAQSLILIGIIGAIYAGVYQIKQGRKMLGWWNVCIGLLPVVLIISIVFTFIISPPGMWSVNG